MSSNAHRDRRWIQGIRSRESAIINEIYKDILPGIIHWVKENNGNDSDARDLFQEMMIAVYKKCKDDDFKLTCSFWSFALIICRNLWYAKNRNKDKMTYKDVINDEEVILDENIQKDLEHSDQLELYRKHFSILKEDCQKILSMFFEKVKMTEIASKMGLTPAYVKKKKYKCKEALIESIQKDELYEELKY